MIRRLVSTLLIPLTAMGCGVALARDGAGYPPVEYRFDNPQLLTQQVLWGVFHGVRLLGLACQTKGDHRAALAYAEWAEKQQVRIRAAERDLARYYYRRSDAAPEAISQALGLRPELQVVPELLDAACKTLPEALSQERYDLEKFYAQRHAAAPKGTWKEPESALLPQPAVIENNETQPKEQP